MSQTTQVQGWHTSEWGMWGWIETILKLIALGIGILAFFQTPANDLVLGGNPHLAAVILLVLLSLASVAQLGIVFSSARRSR